MWRGYGPLSSFVGQRRGPARNLRENIHGLGCRQIFNDTLLSLDDLALVVDLAHLSDHGMRPTKEVRIRLDLVPSIVLCHRMERPRRRRKILQRDMCCLPAGGGMGESDVGVLGPGVEWDEDQGVGEAIAP